MTGTLAPAAWILTSVLAGIVAAVVMNYPMSRGTDGFVPARVTAAMLTRQSPDAVSLRDALLVHHVTGAAAGLAYAGISYPIALVVPNLLLLPGNVGTFPHLLAISLLVVVLDQVFNRVLFPRVSGTAYEERGTAIQGHWLRALLVFAVTMALAVPVLASAVV